MKIVWQKIYKSAQMIPYMYNPVSHILPSHWKRLIKPEASLMKLKFISLLGNQVCSKISLRHALLRWQESYSCGKRGNNNKKEALEHGFEPAPAMWSHPPLPSLTTNLPPQPGTSHVLTFQTLYGTRVKNRVYIGRP